MTNRENKTDSAEKALDAAQVWEMIAAIDIGMLATYSAKGLRGRPMSTIPKAEEGRIYILTEGDSSAAEDIGTTADVFLSYQGRGDHVAINGTAKIDKSADLVKALWSPGAQIFWPDGPETHGVVALVIDPDHADVWDGHNPVRGIVGLVRSVLSGESPDLGTRGETKL